MTLSNNEFLSLVKRALEGAGWTTGRYEEPAAMLGWLHVHGIHWLDNLTDLWPRLTNSSATAPELMESHAARSILDAGHASLLACGPNAIDLAFTNACSETLASIEIRRCCDRTLILPGLATLAARGASALARWHTSDALHVATIRADATFPDYYQFDVPAVSPEQFHSLFVSCSRRSEGMNHHLRNLSNMKAAYPVLTHRGRAFFEHHKARSESHGVNVREDAYALLQATGDQVLVEATEQSRRGAG